MSETIIKVENLSKQYRIGAKERYKTFRETLVDAAKAPFRRISGLNPKPQIRNRQSETIWALRDVSFEVNQGEVVGIIGRNGAGKTTLLKILSKITEPTEGRVELRGRVGSLLEVGTGFHPELTGHENVYLYGAILGMDRWEVTRKFDEIIAFAELEKFVDTPVKRYSSGMYMRLAFAVAAHLEPEILLVDEVLAVGDAAFQKKCMGKMGDVSKEGRTVLFISHNMGAVGALCGNAIWLDRGQIAGHGDVNSVINRYLNAITKPVDKDFQLKDRPRGEGRGEEFRFESIWTETSKGERKTQFQMEEPIIVVFSYAVKKEMHLPLVAMRLETPDGQIIVDSWDSDSLEPEECKPGFYTVRVKIEPQDLHPGLYQISLIAAVHLVRWLDKIDSAMRIEILPVGKNRIWRSERRAILSRIFEWERSYESRFSD
jgi:lipopolysaccharide transport system ATP-binding protein